MLNFVETIVFDSWKAVRLKQLFGDNLDVIFFLALALWFSFLFGGGGEEKGILRGFFFLSKISDKVVHFMWAIVFSLNVCKFIVFLA